MPPSAEDAAGLRSTQQEDADRGSEGRADSETDAENQKHGWLLKRWLTASLVLRNFLMSRLSTCRWINREGDLTWYHPTSYFWQIGLQCFFLFGTFFHFYYLRYNVHPGKYTDLKCTVREIFYICLFSPAPVLTSVPISFVDCPHTKCTPCDFFTLRHDGGSQLGHCVAVVLFIAEFILWYDCTTLYHFTVDGCWGCFQFLIIVFKLLWTFLLTSLGGSFKYFRLRNLVVLF